MAGKDDSKGFIRRTVQGALNMTDERYTNTFSFVKDFFSELFGTGLLVFVGCMGVGRTGESHLGVALSFGIAAFIAIQICCHNSGGHINPSLTLVAVIFKKVSIPRAIVYIAGQTAGSVLGFGLLLSLQPSNAPQRDFCLTTVADGITGVQAFAFEAVMTAVLMLVVCSIWDPRNGTLLDSATLKFGFAIFSLAFAGAGYTGCSMNPARSFGPALWLNRWENHWIYWVGPFTGAIISSLIYTTFFCGTVQPTTSKREKVEMDTVTSS